jgi:protein-S-isoprenylcysteine O-methyltransferase Ste14
LVVWPAYLFALPLAGRVQTLGQSLMNLDGASFHQLVFILQQLATIAFFALIVTLFVVRAPASGQHATRMQALVALLGTFILSVAGLLPAESSASTTSLLTSSALVITGTFFAIWSLAVLGRCFGIFPEVRGLVLSGPYRLIRHPVYLGEMVAAAGILLVKPHPLTVALLAAFVGLQCWRTLFEERALALAFPRDYPSYRASVPRLVPGWHLPTARQVARTQPVTAP